MEIPVFISRPSRLTDEQDLVATWLLAELEAVGLQPRTLGMTDFAVESPLREVLVLARHCAGGIIMGFDRGKGQGPTPWNQLEAGILYGTDLPLLVFADKNVEDGIFGVGASELYISQIPYTPDKQTQARQTLLAWQGKVRDHYYDV